MAYARGRATPKDKIYLVDITVNDIKCTGRFVGGKMWYREETEYIYNHSLGGRDQSDKINYGIKWRLGQ